MSLSDLGAAVRWLREHTEPAAAGLPAGGLRGNGRRVRGLRREELADLAGVSADYIRRLEQGTAVCICDAAWTVVAWNSAWEALRCGEQTSHNWDQNIAWRTFNPDSGRVRRSPEQAARF